MVQSNGDGDGEYYLKYIRKTSVLSGAQVLEQAERHVRALGGRALSLQDASFITCAGTSTYVFDLTFRQQLAHGQTWYEKHGYRTDDLRLREAVRRAIARYAALPLPRITASIRRQVAALMAGKPWTAANTSVLHNGLLQERPPVEMASGTTQTRVLRARRRLLALLERAAPSAKLGEWLVSLECVDYAFFMEAMYGDHYGNRPRWAIAEAGGVRTPTLALFQQANGIHRFAGRLRWRKTLV